MLDKVKNFVKKPIFLLGAYLVLAVVLVIVSFAVLNIPVVAVGAIIVLETLLAAFLNRIPLWIHGLVVIAQIIAGILAAKVVFMVLMVVLYAAAVAFLYYYTLKKTNE